MTMLNMKITVFWIVLNISIHIGGGGGQRPVVAPNTQTSTGSIVHPALCGYRMDPVLFGLDLSWSPGNEESGVN
jgi:hypothetical protein